LNGVTRDADGSTRPLVSRTFDSFTQAKLENAQSRIYLGIHWAFDRDEGVRTGDAVADFVFDHALQPAGHHHSTATPLVAPMAAVSTATQPDSDAPLVIDGAQAAAVPQTVTYAASTTQTISRDRSTPKRISVDQVMSEIGDLE